MKVNQKQKLYTIHINTIKSNEKNKEIDKIIEEDVEENSEDSEDKQVISIKSNFNKITNIYDDFYKKENLNPSFKINSNRIKLINGSSEMSNHNNNIKKERHSSLLSNLIFEKEEEKGEDEVKNYDKVRIDKSISEDDASEVEVNSNENINISDILSNHLTTSPNCNSMNLSELQSSEKFEEEEEDID